MDPIQVRDKLLNLDDKLSIFDLDKIICQDQIKVAVDRALRAEENETMIADNWGVEVLLHLAGTHQIKDAIKLLAITKETKNIGIISDNEETPVSNAQKGLPSIEFNDELIKWYQLSGNIDPCKEIISRGVNVILDHQ